MHDPSEDPEPDAGPDDDVELFLSVAEAGFSGPQLDLFVTALVHHCRPILNSWLYSGRIFKECAGEGRPLEVTHLDREDLRTRRDDRAELTDETIAHALAAFLADARRGEGWSPDGGRSITSYFVTACVLRFPGVFRRWSGERRRQPVHRHYGLDPRDSGLDQHAPAHLAPDPADDVIGRHTTTREMQNMEPRMRAIVQGLVNGESHALIGARLGMTARAVEAMVYRYRRGHGGGR
ncbi:hypothetical protein ACVGOW_08735 [Pseudonocardia saturnea]